MKRLTQKEFVSRVNEVHNNEFKVLSEYKLSKDKVKVLHLPCNNTYEVEAGSIMRGSGCPFCKGVAKPDTKGFQLKLDKRFPNKFKVISDYKGLNYKVSIQCLKCKGKFDMVAGELYRRNCPLCGRRRESDDFEECFNRVAGSHYNLLSKYITSRDKIEVKHLVCNKTFKLVANNFLQGSRCPYCNSSSGEQAIASYLDSKGIRYVQQKRFKSCKDKLPLPFDFYLPDYNTLIEHQGRQHLECVEVFDEYLPSSDKLKYTMKHDRIKRDWSINNGYNLIYTYDRSNTKGYVGSIEEQLDKKLLISIKYMI